VFEISYCDLSHRTRPKRVIGAVLEECGELALGLPAGTTAFVKGEAQFLNVRSAVADGLKKDTVFRGINLCNFHSGDQLESSDIFELSVLVAIGHDGLRFRLGH
jgi:hypothetical protein